MEFSTTINLVPLPVDAKVAARQALHFQAKVDEAGSLEAAVQAVVEAILSTPADAAPSEHKRLHLLYQRAHSRAELEALVSSTFAALGIR